MCVNFNQYSKEVDWFLKCFDPETKQRRREIIKAILFLKNFSAHPSEEELI